MLKFQRSRPHGSSSYRYFYVKLYIILNNERIHTNIP
nr:MAG TPA: hypothetical protein [Caudoviricetes sp.]